MNPLKWVLGTNKNNTKEKKKMWYVEIDPSYYMYPVLIFELGPLDHCASKCFSSTLYIISVNNICAVTIFYVAVLFTDEFCVVIIYTQLFSLSFLVHMYLVGKCLTK